MAFLSTSNRFGPDLDKYRNIQPNPSTYEPVNTTLASGSPFCSTSRYGTIGPHYDVALHHTAAASPAALALASIEDSPSSSNSQRQKAPTPWQYTPTKQGQFSRVYTVEDLEEKRRKRVQAAKLSGVMRKAATHDKPDEVQHLALGPGTYEVDKDWNLEAISVPFSFGKDRRRSILECSVGEKDLRSDARRQDKYSRKISADERRRSETALLPLRRALPSHTGDVADLSQELAKSYEGLQRSSSRLERKLSSPALRSEKYRRFCESRLDREAFRRGPGSYFGEDALKPAILDATEVSPSLPLDDQQRQQLEALLQKESTPVTLNATRKTSTTFGQVKHRDMLKSMAGAGHLSAVAVEDEIGPGVYEIANSTFEESSHNIRYKPGLVSKSRRLRQLAPRSPRDESEQELRGGRCGAAHRYHTRMRVKQEHSSLLLSPSSSLAVARRPSLTHHSKNPPQLRYRLER